MQKNVISRKRPKEQCDFLFTTQFNTPINSSIYSSAIKSIVDTINMMRDVSEEMQSFGGHTFRHTFATRCFEAGVQPKVVQSYLGHATLQMTMVMLPQANGVIMCVFNPSARIASAA